jgi:phosphoribosylaminoimidazole-succinocarboxamide synthase
MGKIKMHKLKEFAEGKTKILYQHPKQADKLLIRQKDILTVKNGLVKTPIAGISNYKALQNDAIQTFLKRHGIPTSYHGLVDGYENLALADKADMMGVEFVERSDSAPNGSWALRNPGRQFRKGDIVSEMFDKRSVVKLDNETVVIMDEEQAAKYYPDIFHADPYIRENIYTNGDDGRVDYFWDLYDQKRPIKHEDRLVTVRSPYKYEHIHEAAKLSQRSFVFLTHGLKLAGKRFGLDINLIDDKTEYGFVGKDKKVVLSDDLTADAFRMDVIKDGVKQDSSKQTFRDLESSGASEETIRRVMPEVYARTTEITEALRDINL